MGGAERWLTADKDDVSIDGINHRVDWVKGPAGELDFRSRKSDFGEFITIMPDPILERQRNERATADIAARLCGGPSALVNTTTEGAMYFIRRRCGA